MQWLTSNLLPFVIAGVTCLFAALFNWKSQRRRAWLATIGCALLVLAGAGLVKVVVSAPDDEETIVQLQSNDHRDKIRQSLLDVLRQDWNANDAADWPVAEVLAEVSQIAYLPPSEAKPEFKAMGFTAVETVADASMLGYVLAINDSVIVAFRGTDDTADWVANLDRFTVETSQGPVHRGFHNAYLPLAKQVVELLNKTDNKHTWITGHSLGGALAVLCAYDLAENHQTSIDGLITFGQPMVARPPLTNHIEMLLPGRFAHYVNQSDIVPRIPPSFDHCGSLVWYKGDEIRRSKPRNMLLSAAPGDKYTGDFVDDRELEPLSKDVFVALQREIKGGDKPEYGPDGRLLMKGNSPFITDHNMELYLEGVRASGKNPRE